MDLVFQKIWKKSQKVVNIEVYPNFLKNGSNDFPNSMCEFRSNPSLPSSENRMPSKNHLLKIIGPKSRAGWVSGPVGPLFKREYLGNQENKSKSDWIFRKSKESTFEMPHVKFRLSPLLHPENRDWKSPSSSSSICRKIMSFDLFLKMADWIFLIFCMPLEANAVHIKVKTGCLEKPAFPKMWERCLFWAVFGHFEPVLPKFSRTGYIFKNQALSVFYVYCPLTSCKKSDKTDGRFSSRPGTWHNLPFRVLHFSSPLQWS